MSSYLSQYELAVKNGFRGTQEEWVQAIMRNEHNAMGGRDKEDAHPMSSITGLTEALKEASARDKTPVGEWTALEVVTVDPAKEWSFEVQQFGCQYEVLKLPEKLQLIANTVELEVIVLGLGATIPDHDDGTGVFTFSLLSSGEIDEGAYPVCVVNGMNREGVVSHITRHRILLSGGTAYVEVSGMENGEFVHRYEERTVSCPSVATHLQFGIFSVYGDWATHGVIFRYREVLSHE